MPWPQGGGAFSPIRGKVAPVLKRLVAQKPDATVRELPTRFDGAWNSFQPAGLGSLSFRDPWANQGP